jgi:hypothetical protein
MGPAGAVCAAHVDTFLRVVLDRQLVWKAVFHSFPNVVPQNTRGG